MDFSWALQQMREGNKVKRRKDRAHTEWNLCLINNKLFLHSERKQSADIHITFLDTKDILAEDWEFYNE